MTLNASSSNIATIMEKIVSKDKVCASHFGVIHYSALDFPAHLEISVPLVLFRCRTVAGADLRVSLLRLVGA